jgi:hypothetical protein
MGITSDCMREADRLEKPMTVRSSAGWRAAVDGRGMRPPERGATNDVQSTYQR